MFIEDATIDTVFTCTEGGKGISQIIELLGFSYNLLLITVPIIVIIFGIIELVKAVTAGKEDTMKKAVNKLIKLVIIAVLVFFVGLFIKVVVNILDENVIKDTDTKACLDLFFGE